MGKLHELLAVLGDSTATANAVLEETVTTFMKRPDHFKGQVRAVTYLDESREGENLSEEKAMVTTVSDKLDYTFTMLGKHFDGMLQLEEANTRAKADLIVDGTTLMKDVPATFLLGMENRLKKLQSVLLQVPTLEQAMVWHKDEAAGTNAWRSDPQKTTRTEKQNKHRVLYEATKEHPAQIQTWTEDVVVATIETTHTSGMMTSAEKSAVLGRLDKLIAAVKKARQRANTVEVNDLKISSLMFDYIVGK